jgi:DNA-binding beta-propeller fold protein YncE
MPERDAADCPLREIKGHQLRFSGRRDCRPAGSRVDAARSTPAVAGFILSRRGQTEMRGPTDVRCRIVVVGVIIISALSLVGIGASFGTTQPIRSVTFTVLESEAAGSVDPIAETFTMATNLSTTDPVAVARSYVVGELRSEWRTIGRMSYAAASELGRPSKYGEASDYVVPQFEGESDFDPAVLWKLLKAVSVGPVVRLGTTTIKGKEATQYKLTLSTSRFIELQGVTQLGEIPGVESANPVQELLQSAAGMSWTTANPYVTATLRVPVTASVSGDGLIEIRFAGTEPERGPQVFEEYFVGSSNVVHVVAPQVPPMPTTACQSTTTAVGPELRPRIAYSPTIGSSFDVVATSNGRYSFVSDPDGSVSVYSDASFAPKLLRAVNVPGQPLGEALTTDGTYLLVADESGVAVLAVTALLGGVSANPVVGQLQAPTGEGAIEVAISPDDRFAFVTLEDSSQMAVFNLGTALASNFSSSGFVGFIPLGLGPVGIAIAPNGQTMYVTSESGATAGSDGTLSVISMSGAETSPSNAVVSNVIAGCSPVRVITSSNGADVWVSARGSNQILAYSAPGLVTDPSTALIAQVTVGQSPVDLSFVDNDARIVVADSNRFYVQGAWSALSVVDPAAALAGHPALLGSIPTGLFPRQISVEPNGSTMLVTDYDSSQLEAVSTSGLG